MMTFSEFLMVKAVEEGVLLPDKPVSPGLPRINTTPYTNAQRRRLQPKPVKASPPMPPLRGTLPNRLIPKS
jgi:hypothetical protein